MYAQNILEFNHEYGSIEGTMEMKEHKRIDT
jgi:hypothetical protein